MLVICIQHQLSRHRIEINDRFASLNKMYQKKMGKSQSCFKFFSILIFSKNLWIPFIGEPSIELKAKVKRPW